MAEKAKQHILPVVYQRPFADSSLPAGWPKDRPFEPRIWQIPRTLEAGGEPRSPANAFHANKFYNLRDDDPADPQIERGLGELESAYGQLLPRLHAREELPLEDYLRLLIFVGALRARTRHQLEHWQKQWAEVERVHRMVERAHTGREVSSDARFWMGDETAKRMLFGQASSYASVIGPSSWILVNESRIPFLSSDNPATHAFLHRVELEGLGFSAESLDPDALHSQKAFFAFCPISPTLALLSSPLLVPPTDSLYRVSSSHELILSLNEYTRHCSKEFVISPVEDPYGPIADLLRAMDRTRRKMMEELTGCGVTIYSKDDRISVACEEAVIEDGPNPLSPRVRFRTRQTQALERLSVGLVVGEVTVYENFRPASFVRGGRVITLAAASDQDTIIEGDVEVAI